MNTRIFHATMATLVGVTFIGLLVLITAFWQLVGIVKKMLQVKPSS